MATKGHRYMVEEIAVTPFFKRHRGHMPATIKLLAEIKEARGNVVLEADARGYAEEDIEVSATPDTIDLTLVLERTESEVLRFHNSYPLPAAIDTKTVKIENKGGKLRITAHKK